MNKNKLFRVGFCFLFLLIISIPIRANAEEVAIDKIEIEGVNYNLKVGEEPSLNAHLINYADDIILDEFFMSTNRASTIGIDDESSDGDRLIKDFIYFHIIDLDIKEGAGIKFDNNTKFYINGELAKISYISESGSLAVIDSEENKITPQGYIASNYLDDDFIERHNIELNEIIVKAIKEGKVTFDSDETKAAIDNAIANNSEISIEYGPSESMTKSQIYFMSDFHYDELEGAIKEGQKLAAYYTVDIAVFIDGYITGLIKTIDIPLSVTIPYPNGLPNLDKGYDRLWKVYRYHDGEIVEIDATKTEYGISFMTDKFSPYVLAYELVKKEDEPVEEIINNPKTGDNILFNLNILLLSSAGIFLLRKMN